jgi:hypothetical protein
MDEPGWVRVASNHAVITKDELLEWLRIPSRDLKPMLDNQGFPSPRFVGGKSPRSGLPSKVLSSRCRWRVGDVRAWLEGGRRLEAELATEIAAEKSEHNRAAERTRELCRTIRPGLWSGATKDS